MWMDMCVLYSPICKQIIVLNPCRGGELFAKSMVSSRNYVNPIKKLTKSDNLINNSMKAIKLLSVF